VNNELKNAENHLSKSAFENLKIWFFDERYKEFHTEIEKLIIDEKWEELEESFFKVLEFGTAGRRGKVGVGPNRINLITVSESAQALADYLKLKKEHNLSVAIGWDVRNSSKELSRRCAEVLAANQIKVFYFDSPRSTPELSFAVRELKASAGIVISASHNPPQDNGIKVYWNDGAQVSSPNDKNLMKIAQNIKDIKIGNFEELKQSGKIQILGEEIDEKYINTNTKLSVGKNRNAKIVFSPIHGTGSTNLLRTLKSAGFKDIILVNEQMSFDGDFSTLPDKKPNPENLSANKMAIKKLKQTRADIALTTDPDADRICVMSLEKNGEVRSFSGNQTAILAADYLLSKIHDKINKYENLYFKDRRFICKSFVTTDALNALAKKYGIKIYDDLMVGFKFIGKKILQKESEGEIFVAGFEESLGGLVGDQTRDKDAATIGLIISELASDLQKENKTLGEKLDEIYLEIGFFTEKTESVEFFGLDGFNKMQEIMRKVKSGEETFGATKIKDFESLTETDAATGEKNKFSMLEGGNAVSFEFAKPENRITIRPSGTEPKIKIYAQWLFSKKEDCAKIEEIITDFKRRILNER
jgi:phosphoglucomutase phosphomannomutase